MPPLGSIATLPSSPQKVAILIGINEYRHGVPPLRNAIRDAHSLGQVLSEQHGYLVRLVLDDQATLSELRRLFTELAAETTTNTALILYFAGHGIAQETTDDGSGPQGFLLPQDARRDEPASFLPMTEIQQLLSPLPCKHLLLVLDCCFAGAFRWSQTRSLRPRPAKLYRERYERYLRDPAWQILASAAADELALDAVAGGRLGQRGSEADNSPFASALCRGLMGAADLRFDGQPGDGVIAANELHVYLEATFERLEQQLRRSLQKPLLWSPVGKEKGQFCFLVPGRVPALPSALELVEQNNPYRGLDSYEEPHAELFFGRSEVAEQLLQGVMGESVIVISGPSGCGKSSLIQAGLCPRLRALPGWHIAPTLRPSYQPLAALEELGRTLGASQPGDLRETVTTWCTQNPHKQLLIIIDPFERFATLEIEAAVRRQFVSTLYQSIKDHPGRLRVLIAVSTDYIGHFPELFTNSLVHATRFELPALSRQQLRQVIEAGASERVLYFEPPSLVDDLVDEVADMPGALGLLSQRLSDLYLDYVRSAHSDRCLRQDPRQSADRIGAILTNWATLLERELDEPHRATLQRILLRMVMLAAGSVGYRRVPLRELRYPNGSPEDRRVQTVIRKLRETRLVVFGLADDDVPYVEPVHQKLLLAWPGIWDLIRGEQESIALHRLLTHDAETWAAQGWRSRDLWSSNSRLPLLIELTAKQPLRFNALESEFIKRSVRTRRVQRNSVIVVLLGIICILLLGIWNIREQQQATQAQMQLAHNRLIDSVNTAEQIVFIADRKLAELEGADRARDELLSLSLDLLSKLGPDAQNRPDTQRTTVSALIQQTQLKPYQDGALSAHVLRLYDDAIQVQESAVRATPSDSLALAELARLYTLSARSLRQAGFRDQAIARYRQALKIQKEFYPTKCPTYAHCQPWLDNYLALATIEDEVGDIPSAIDSYSKAQKILTDISIHEIDNKDNKWDLSRTVSRIAKLQERSGNIPLAINYYQEAVAACQALVAIDPTDMGALREIAKIYAQMGRITLSINGPLVAADYYHKALNIQTTVTDSAPKNLTWQKELLEFYHLYGRALLIAGDDKKAYNIYDAELALRSKLAHTNPAAKNLNHELLASYRSIGTDLEKSGKYAEAAVRYKRALALRSKLAETSPSDFIDLEYDLAALYRRQGDAAKAKGDLGAAQNDYEQAFALHQRLVAQHPGDPIHRQPLLDSLITLLQLAQQRGDRVAAKRHLQAARAMQADLAQKGLFVSDDVLQLLRGPP